MPERTLKSGMLMQCCLNLESEPMLLARGRAVGRDQPVLCMGHSDKAVLAVENLSTLLLDVVPAMYLLNMQCT